MFKVAVHYQYIDDYDVDNQILDCYTNPLLAIKRYILLRFLSSCYSVKLAIVW